MPRPGGALTADCRRTVVQATASERSSKRARSRRVAPSLVLCMRCLSALLAVNVADRDSGRRLMSHRRAEGRKRERGERRTWRGESPPKSQHHTLRRQARPAHTLTREAATAKSVHAATRRPSVCIARRHPPHPRSPARRQAALPFLPRHCAPSSLPSSVISPLYLSKWLIHGLSRISQQNRFSLFGRVSADNHQRWNKANKQIRESTSLKRHCASLGPATIFLAEITNFRPTPSKIETSRFDQIS